MRIMQRMSDYEIGISKKELTLLLKKLTPQEIEELIKRTPTYEETIKILQDLKIKILDINRKLDRTDLRTSYFPSFNHDRCDNLVHNTRLCHMGRTKCVGKEACMKRSAKIYNVSLEYWKECLRNCLKINLAL